MSRRSSHEVSDGVQHVVTGGHRLDIGNKVFHLVGFAADGKIAFRKRISRLGLKDAFDMAAPVSTQTVGVVLMHGNTDTPSGTIATLAAALEGAGYPVESPEMCWSYRRRRDRPLLDCLSELEAPIERLSGRGVRAIVVAGMSVGGLGALAFGARRHGLAGIIALAANGSPERLVRLFPQIAQSVTEAQAMVASGRGDERASFTDGNIRGLFRSIRRRRSI